MTAQLSDVAGKTFDYVIVGGGTAGLTLAGRLTEDSSISVVVLEAGEANIDDPKIMIPGQLGHTFMNQKYDWLFHTTKQKYSNNHEYHWARGKGLGGSSAMNFYSWIKPPAGDFNALEELGNPGWNWEEYLKYSRISETFHVAGKEQADLFPHTHDPEFRGTSGPIQTTVPHHVHTIDLIFQETMKNRGLKSIKDPYGGDITGTFMASANLDPKTWTRSYSVTGYYLINKDRPNLTVIVEATVARVVFADATVGQDLTSTGVEFIYGGKTFVVNARKEVILSAGAIKSPQILELSGVGRPDVLSRIGIEPKIDLPGVGENVQEHLYMGISFELNQNLKHETYDLMREPEYAAKALALFKEGKGMHRMGITSFAYFSLSTANPKDAPSLIDRVAKDVQMSKTSGVLPPGLAEQHDIQIRTLRSDALPDLETIGFPGFVTKRSVPEPGKSYATIQPVLNHPFSRGTIHAKSNNPFEQPEIDPRYFENDFDLEILVQLVKFVRSLVDTEPWKSNIVREVDPGPECISDEQIREYIKEAHGTCWHTVGSTSMLPREKQGVVDPNLKVYGTTNLRVVDIGIIPLHLAAHTHATAYMIGEKATDIIRGIVRK